MRRLHRTFWQADFTQLVRFFYKTSQSHVELLCVWPELFCKTVQDSYPDGLRLIHFALSQVFVVAEARGRNRTKETEDLKYGRQPRLPLVGFRANLYRNTLSEQYLFVHCECLDNSEAIFTSCIKIFAHRYSQEAITLSKQLPLVLIDLS